MQCHLERFIRERRRKEAFSSNNSEKLLRRHFQRGLEAAAAAAVRTEKARAKEENSTLALKLPFSANKTRIDTATALKFKIG